MKSGDFFLLTQSLPGEPGDVVQFSVGNCPNVAERNLILWIPVDPDHCEEIQGIPRSVGSRTNSFGDDTVSISPSAGHAFFAFSLRLLLDVLLSCI